MLLQDLKDGFKAKINKFRARKYFALQQINCTF